MIFVSSSLTFIVFAPHFSLLILGSYVSLPPSVFEIPETITRKTGDRQLIHSVNDL